MSFTMMQCHPDAQRLATWAARFKLSAGGGDLDYVLHTLLTSAFGTASPKPFRFFGDARGLLGYATTDADALQLAADTASPEVHAALGLNRFAARPFPVEWAIGRRLAFEARVRPIVRMNDGRERDVFLAKIDEEGNADNLSREDTYARWFARELARYGAARIEHIQMESFRLSSSLRKGRESEGKRPARHINGPDAVFSGELTVTDPAGFSASLARGIGRHRAFGFGMLLLRPPTPC